MNNSSIGHESLSEQDPAKLGQSVLYEIPVHICHIKSGF